MATEVTIPDFDFSAFYYPELLEALIQYKRRNVPELTEELPYEPFIQLLRAFALVGHINNTLIDLVANESTLPTAKLVETVRNMLRLINYELRPATPAQVDIVYELSKVFTASFAVISTTAQAATKRDGDTPAIYYEALESLIIERTDQFSYVYAYENGAYANFTTKANSPITPADDWTPWATPAVKDAIYWGHKQVMWNTLSAILTSPAANIVGVFEFYDGTWRKAAPTSATDIGGGQLKFDLTSLLGAQNRQGTQIRVMYNETTAYETVESTWDGSKNIAITGLLGQTAPTTDETKYSIGSDWSILESVEDESLDFTQDGKVEYPIPHTQTQNWKKTTVNGVSAYWLRYRIVSVSTPTSPTFQQTRMDEGKQYVLRQATQGKSRSDSPLGSSTGLANQRFTTTQNYFINGSETVYVDGEPWTRVSNFLSSNPGDKHYTIELGANDKATIVFGDGISGRIPPLGVGNIGVSYRHAANDNGNVGANTVTVDKTGLTFINKLWNPRQATGWAEAQGASESSLEIAKVEGPASLRIKDVAISPDDVVTLTIQFEDDDGSVPFGRARAFEEGFGPKTIEVVVVTKGGGLASADQIDALETHFNGDQYSYPPKPKHLVANQTVVAVNYTPKLIDIEATVYGDVTEEAITNRLQKVIQPEALKDDGVTWEWEFGGEVPLSRLSHEIFETSETITKVILTTPASDVSLLPRELPQLGTVSITVIEP